MTRGHRLIRMASLSRWFLWHKYDLTAILASNRCCSTARYSFQLIAIALLMQSGLGSTKIFLTTRNPPTWVEQGNAHNKHQQAILTERRDPRLGGTRQVHGKGRALKQSQTSANWSRRFDGPSFVDHIFLSLLLVVSAYLCLSHSLTHTIAFSFLSASHSAGHSIRHSATVSLSFSLVVFLFPVLTTLHLFYIYTYIYICVYLPLLSRRPPPPLLLLLLLLLPLPLPLFLLLLCWQPLSFLFFSPQNQMQLMHPRACHPGHNYVSIGKLTMAGGMPFKSTCRVSTISARESSTLAATQHVLHKWAYHARIRTTRWRKLCLCHSRASDCDSDHIDITCSTCTLLRKHKVTCTCLGKCNDSSNFACEL